MALFDNSEPEELLLFMKNLNMTLAASEKLAMSAKNQYLHTVLCGKSLRHFDLLSADVEVLNTLTVKHIILGIDLYYFPVNFLLKKERSMHRIIGKPHGLKIRRYSACLIGLNSTWIHFLEHHYRKNWSD